MVGIHIQPSLEDKLRLSSRLVLYEECPDLGLDEFIYPAKAYGRQVPIFKVLLSNICVNNCLYCANRIGRSCKRYKFSKEEFVKVFKWLYERGEVQGLFISSAIYKDPNDIQREMIEIIHILREKYNYNGYVHCKILPGVKDELIEEASKVSDRISLNLEAPGERYLREIAPAKGFLKLFSQLKRISRIGRELKLKAGASTQLIVGIGKEDDRTILTLAERLYRELGLRRVYYSGFQPVQHTPLDKKDACSNLRQLRLYQADFLIRNYGFKAPELIYDREGNLILDKDPKLAWAERNLEPIDLNKASFEELIRVPGIGKETANKILELRRQGKKVDREVLKDIGIKGRQVLKFII